VAGDPERRAHLEACVLATAAGLSWALTLEMARLIPAGVPTREIVWGRYGIQLVLLAVIFLPRRGLALVRTSRPGLQALRGLMMLAMPIAFTLAVQVQGSTTAWSQFWVGPLIAVGLAVALLHEDVARPTLLLALVATAGAIFVSGIPQFPSVTGASEGLFAAGTFAVYLVLTRLLRSESAATGLFWTAACVFVPVSFIVPFRWQPLTAMAVLGIATMGVFWLLTLLAIDEALRRAPLGVVLPFLLSEVVWVKVLERLLFGTGWPLPGRVAGVIVLAAAVFLVMREVRSHPVHTAVAKGTGHG
jgi:drug/metabolite transporter (DMT)-like permease